MLDRTILALGAGGLLAAGLLGGCGRAPARAASTTASSNQADGLKFAQCMRSHGVDVPDPSTTGNGGFSLHISSSAQVAGGAATGPINPVSTTFQQAQSACQKYLPNGGVISPQQQQQAQQNALEYAQCMRAHGVDVPDPSTQGGGVMFNLGGSINPDDPAFQSAQTACASKLGKTAGGKVTIQGGGPLPGGASGGSLSVGVAG